MKLSHNFQHNLPEAFDVNFVHASNGSAKYKIPYSSEPLTVGAETKRHSCQQKKRLIKLTSTHHHMQTICFKHMLGADHEWFYI